MTTPSPSESPAPMSPEYWNSVAGPRWVESQEQLDGLLLPYAEHLRSTLAAFDGRHIADIGCGCGATTLLARQAAPRADILAVDVSEPMLRHAESRARACGDVHTRFLHADASQHPVEPATVDLLISRFGVMFFTDPIAAFSHLRSWLTPEGQMSFVVWGTPDRNGWLTDGTRALAPLIGPTPEPDLTVPGPFSLSIADRRAEVFGRAGLTVESTVELDAPMSIPGSVDDILGFYLQRGPVAAALAQADSSHKDHLLDALRDWVASVHHNGAVTRPALALHLTLRPTR
jgi:SAM-dependent methyltransferase